jgi:hypothetical protein
VSRSELGAPSNHAPSAGPCTVRRVLHLTTHFLSPCVITAWSPSTFCRLTLHLRGHRALFIRLHRQSARSHPAILRSKTARSPSTPLKKCLVTARLFILYAIRSVRPSELRLIQRARSRSAEHAPSKHTLPEGRSSWPPGSPELNAAQPWASQLPSKSPIPVMLPSILSPECDF